MTFVVVGGGPTGVEMAGQLRELSRRALRRNYRMIDPVDTRVVLVEGVDGLDLSMGTYLSRMTARDLTRMGVEIHLQGHGDQHGRERRRDHQTGRQRPSGSLPPPRCGRPARVPRGWAPPWPRPPRRRPTRRARSWSTPTARFPTHPEVFVVGDLMSHRDNLPGVAEVAIQSGAHAAHSIVRRLEGKPTKPFKYRDLGTLAVISRFTAVAKIGPIKVGGFLGWLLWLVVHITFLTGFKNRFGALTRWLVSFVGRGRYERALIGRWVARTKRRANLNVRFGTTRPTKRGVDSMPINVTPIAGLSDDINDIRLRTARIVNEKILPNESRALARPGPGRDRGGAGRGQGAAR